MSTGPTGLLVQPDWDAITDPIHCPLCEYNLRGLPEPRCPECGYRFEWSELLDPARRAHAYLFEHHPERNVWSFFRTLGGGLRPATFWRSLHPGQPSRRGRLALYALLTTLPMLIVWVAHVVIAIVVEWQREHALMLRYFQRRLTTTPPRPFRREYLWPLYRQSLDSLTLLGVCIVVWPWLTLGALLLFQWSMRRAKVKQVHVVRCVVYSADLLLTACAIYLLFLGDFWFNHAAVRSRLSFQPTWVLIAIVLLAIFNYRLLQAYTRYLRFDHVGATLLASQIIAGLAVYKLVYVLQGY